MSQQHETPESFTMEQVKLLASQFAQMADEGKQPLTEMLEALVEQRQTFARALENVQADVAAGEPLSRAFLKQSQVFGMPFVEAVREGEVQGDISKALKKFAEAPTTR